MKAAQGLLLVALCHVCLSTCISEDLDAGKAASLLEWHLNEEVFHEDHTSTVISEAFLLIPTDHRRELWAVISEVIEDHILYQYVITATFVRASDGWRIVDYGANLRSVVADRLTARLHSQYREVLEEGQRIQNALREHFPTEVLVDRIGGELTPRRAVEDALGSVEEAIPEWLTVDVVENARGGSALALETFPTEGRPELECVISVEVPLIDPPFQYEWAQGWQREACRGGDRIWLGWDATAADIVEELEEIGTWGGVPSRGW